MKMLQISGSSWNYRIMKIKQYNDEENGEPVFDWIYGIFAVYYNQKLEPEEHSEVPEGVFGGSVEDLMNDLISHNEALQRPILEWTEEKGYKEQERDEMVEFYHYINNGCSH